MLSVADQCAEGCYAGHPYPECCYADHHYAECCCADHHYAECCYADITMLSVAILRVTQLLSL
jgi:hypothetical protein